MTETTQKLLDAAEVRMRRGGYNSVSFRDLAEDTEIKSASVHYHYRRKEDLGVALIQRYHEDFFAALDAATAGLATPQKKLKAFCHIYKRALTDDPTICLCGMLGAESSGLPKSMRTAVVGFFQKNIDWIKTSLPIELSGKAKKVKAEQVLATLQGAMMLATSMQNTKIFDDMVRHLVNEIFD